MKIIKTANEIKKILKEKKKIGFVPTLGSLHNGHISLIKKSKNKKLFTVVSIFVNQLQFNNKKDFNRYPRPLDKDLDICKKNNVDCVFIPLQKEIYPEKKIYVRNKLPKFCNVMEGKFRPGHFNGVIEVVKRLLTIVKCHYLFLGIKDFQQLILIRDFSKKNFRNLRIIPCETIRDINGIALSSRNQLLNTNELKIGSDIYKFLKTNKINIIKNKNKNYFKMKIIKLGATKVDYLECYNTTNFKKTSLPSKKVRVFVAYFIREIRLIDNF